MTDRGAKRITELPSPRGVPFLGNLLQLEVARLHTILEGWQQVHGDMYAVRFGPSPRVLIGAPALIRHILRERPEGFRRMHRFEEVARELRMHGVFSAEGAAWKKHRKLIVPAFANAPLKAFWPAFRETTERLRARWLRSDGAAVDVLADLRCFTVDVTTRLVFGRDLDTLERGTSELHASLDLVFDGLGRRAAAPFALWRYLKLPADRRLEHAANTVGREMQQMISAAHAKLDAGGAAETLLETMMLARDEADHKVRFSDDEVLGNALTLLLAGEDTTANTMAWLLHYIARDPSLQQRLAAEADAGLGAETTLASAEQSQSLRALGATTLEALRLRSPAPIFFVEPLSDVELSGVCIPQGTPLILLVRSAECAELGSSGRELLPDRWLTGATREAWAAAKGSLAFGDGPRICPGRSLALLECAMVAAMACRSFHLEVAAEPREAFKFVMQPEGLRLRLRARS
jgi:cytochrome P450